MVEVQRHIATRLFCDYSGVGRYERVTEILTQLVSAVVKQSNRYKKPAAVWVLYLQCNKC